MSPKNETNKSYGERGRELSSACENGNNFQATRQTKHNSGAEKHATECRKSLSLLFPQHQIQILELVLKPNPNDTKRREAKLRCLSVTWLSVWRLGFRGGCSSIMLHSVSRTIVLCRSDCICFAAMRNRAQLRNSRWQKCIAAVPCQQDTQGSAGCIGQLQERRSGFRFHQKSQHVMICKRHSLSRR